jgi:hypothetical protein
MRRGVGVTVVAALLLVAVACGGEGAGKAVDGDATTPATVTTRQAQRPAVDSAPPAAPRLTSDPCVESWNDWVSRSGMQLKTIPASAMVGSFESGACYVVFYREAGSPSTPGIKCNNYPPAEFWRCSPGSATEDSRLANATVNGDGTLALSSSEPELEDPREAASSAFEWEGALGKCLQTDVGSSDRWFAICGDYGTRVLVCYLVDHTGEPVSYEGEWVPPEPRRWPTNCESAFQRAAAAVSVGGATGATESFWLPRFAG